MLLLSKALKFMSHRTMDTLFPFFLYVFPHLKKERKKKKVMIPLISLKPVTQRNRGSHERGSIGLKWQDLEAGSAQQSPVLQEGQMRLGVKMSFGQRGNVTLMHTVSLERQ